MEIREGKGKRLSDPASVADLFQSILKAEDENDHKKEHFWVIGLNGRLTVEYIELVSLGSLNASLAEPREIFRLAIVKSVALLVVGHNHPSGDPTPSEDDLSLTKRLVEAGKIIGIRITDHIIIGEVGKYYSWSEQGLIKEE